MKQYEVALSYLDLETGFLTFVDDGVSEGTFCGPAEALEEAKRRMNLADEDGTKDKLLSEGKVMVFMTTKLPDSEEKFYRMELVVSFSYDHETLKAVKEYDDRIIIF